jgi:hypothetical protein
LQVENEVSVVKSSTDMRANSKPWLILKLFRNSPKNPPSLKWAVGKMDAAAIHLAHPAIIASKDRQTTSAIWCACHVWISIPCPKIKEWNQQAEIVLETMN